MQVFPLQPSRHNFSVDRTCLTVVKFYFLINGVKADTFECHCLWSYTFCNKASTLFLNFSFRQTKDFEHFSQSSSRILKNTLLKRLFIKNYLIILHEIEFLYKSGWYQSCVI